MGESGFLCVKIAAKPQFFEEKRVQKAAVFQLNCQQPPCNLFAKDRFCE